MSKHFDFILNPKAGSGKAASLVPQISHWCSRNKVSYTLTQTEAKGHAKEISRELGLKHGPSYSIVSVGGDGTLHEVVNGILSLDGPERPALGIIPAGTGNDYVKMFRLERKLHDQLEQLTSERGISVDTAIVEWKDGESRSRCHSVNLVGIGFEALVASKSQSYKRVKGASGYIVAVLSSLKSRESPMVKIETRADDTVWKKVFEGKLLLSSVGVGRFSGGVFNMNPNASINDGFLDFCSAPALSMAKILPLIPKVMKGRHLQSSIVSHGVVREFRVTSLENLPLHADGEVKSLDARSICVKINPGSLNILANTL